MAVTAANNASLDFDELVLDISFLRRLSRRNDGHQVGSSSAVRSIVAVGQERLRSALLHRAGRLHHIWAAAPCAVLERAHRSQRGRRPPARHAASRPYLPLASSARARRSTRSGTKSRIRLCSNCLYALPIARATWSGPSSVYVLPSRRSTSAISTCSSISGTAPECTHGGEPSTRGSRAGPSQPE